MKVSVRCFAGTLTVAFAALVAISRLWEQDGYNGWKFTLPNSIPSSPVFWPNPHVQSPTSLSFCPTAVFSTPLNPPYPPLRRLMRWNSSREKAAFWKHQLRVYYTIHAAHFPAAVILNFVMQATSSLFRRTLPQAATSTIVAVTVRLALTFFFPFLSLQLQHLHIFASLLHPTPSSHPSLTFMAVAAGQTPLHEACWSSHPHIVRLLLNSGIFPFFTHTPFSQPSFHSRYCHARLHECLPPFTQLECRG
jgi:hypothetical protein